MGKLIKPSPEFIAMIKRQQAKSSVPKMRFPPSPPPDRPSLWMRYARGEKIRPTYERIPLWKPVVDPSKLITTQPVAVRQDGGLGKFNDDRFYLKVVSILLMASLIIHAFNAISQ